MPKRTLKYCACCHSIRGSRKAIKRSTCMHTECVACSWLWGRTLVGKVHGSCGLRLSLLMHGRASLITILTASFWVVHVQKAICDIGSTAKVLLKCKLKYYRISECHSQHVIRRISSMRRSGGSRPTISCMMVLFETPENLGTSSSRVRHKSSSGPSNAAHGPITKPLPCTCQLRSRGACWAL